MSIDDQIKIIKNMINILEKEKIDGVNSKMAEKYRAILSSLKELRSLTHYMDNGNIIMTVSPDRYSIIYDIYTEDDLHLKAMQYV